MSKIQRNIVLATDIKNLVSSQVRMTLTALRIKLQSKTIISSSTFTDLESSSTNNLLQISLKEVSYHDNFHDCWIVVYDRVYDVTKFLDKVIADKEFFNSYLQYTYTYILCVQYSVHNFYLFMQSIHFLYEMFFKKKIKF